MENIAKIILVGALLVLSRQTAAAQTGSQSCKTERKVLIRLSEREVQLVKPSNVNSQSNASKKFVYQLQLDSSKTDSKRNLLIRFDPEQPDHSVRQIIGLLSDLVN